MNRAEKIVAATTLGCGLAFIGIGVSQAAEVTAHSLNATTACALQSGADCSRVTEDYADERFEALVSVAKGLGIASTVLIIRQMSKDELPEAL